MRQEIEMLLYRCGLELPGEEITQTILSSSARDLTLRLRAKIQEIQARSPRFLAIKSVSWHIVMPERSDGFARCIKGKDLIDFSVAFPLLIFQNKNLNKTTVEEFEKEWLSTYLEKIKIVKEYSLLLERCYPFSDIETGYLYRLKEALTVRSKELATLYQTIGPADGRQECDNNITEMQACLIVINDELSHRDS